MPTKKDITAHRHHWIDLYKKSNGCSLCGYNIHPSALCFDRLPEYKDSSKPNGGIYRLYDARIALNDLLEEIKKCRVLCCNCHMEINNSHNTRRTIVTHEQLNINTLEATLRRFEINDNT